MNKKYFKIKKKYIFFILIIFFFFLISSYHLKNFQLLLVGIIIFFSLIFLMKLLNSNSFILIFSILSTLTLIEISLFILNNNISLKEKNLNRSEHIKTIKTDIGYLPISGIQNHKIYKDNELIFNTNYTILPNNYRYTPKFDNYAKMKTMNFFGGSFTFGWGLSDKETLPYLTQKYFKNTLINNYAINGNGAHQVYKQITDSENLIGDINIFVTFKNHIPRSSCKRDFTLGSPRYILINGKIQRTGWCGLIFSSKYKVLDIFSKIFNKSEIKKLIDKAIIRKNLFDEKGTNLYLTLIKEINIFLKNMNKEFYVGYISENEEIDNIILEYFKKNNIKYIDLSLDRSNKDNYILNDGHPTKIANIKRAKKISNFLN